MGGLLLPSLIERTFLDELGKWFDLFRILLVLVVSAFELEGIELI